jgi:hypothetical protein
MEFYNNTFCVTGRELIKSDENPDGVISMIMYKKLQNSGRIMVVKRGCRLSPALIVYASIPERYKKLLAEKGITLQTIKNEVEAALQTDFEARDWFATHKIQDGSPDGRNLPPEKQLEYSINAELLNALHHIVNDRIAMRRMLNNSTKNIWPKLAEKVSALKTKLGHTLPDNPRRLNKRLTEYRKSGYISLVSGKFMNNNAKRVAMPEQEAMLRKLLSYRNNLDNEQVKDAYNIVANGLDWETISAGTVANYRKKWNLETFGGRKGETAFDNERAMLIKRKAPTLPLVYWTSDGWDAELLYQKTEVDDKGNSRTTYHNRKTMVVVLDPAANYPVGFAIGDQENKELIRQAFRNAVNHTAELFGQRHKVLQVQSDNYGRKGLLPFYEAVSDKYTPARVKNAKAKVIEPYFKRLNKKYCQLMPNWSGFGVKSKNQPNADYLNKIRHTFPDESGVIIQLERIIEMERAAAINKYRAAYLELPDSDKRLLTEADYLHLLGETTGYTNRISHAGMVATIEGVKREYDCFDPGFRRLNYVDWTLKYDPATPERVLAENPEGTIRYLLQEKYVQPMALYDRKDPDCDQLNQVRGFNKNLKLTIMAGMREDHQLVQGIFDNNPQLNDTLAKMLLVDSNGQHKDNKSALRLGNVRKQLARHEENEKKQKEEDFEAAQLEYYKSKVDISKYLNQ